MHLVTVPPQSVFQALADPIRIRIVRLLSDSREEACLCEFVDSLLEPQYKLSRQIKVLRQAGLVSAEKDGRWVYHRVVAGMPHLEALYTVIRNLPDPDGAYRSDMERFQARMALRKDGRCHIGIIRQELAQNRA